MIGMHLMKVTDSFRCQFLTREGFQDVDQFPSVQEQLNEALRDHTERLNPGMYVLKVGLSNQLYRLELVAS